MDKQRNSKFSFLEVVDGSLGGGREESAVRPETGIIILTFLRAKQTDEASHPGVSSQSCTSYPSLSFTHRTLSRKLTPGDKADISTGN